ASWAEGFTIIASAAVLIALALLAPRKQRLESQLILAMTAGVVVSYYLFIHDLSVLLIPLALTLDGFLAAGQGRDSLHIAAAWTAALLLIAPMCIVLIPNHFYLFAVPLCAFMVVLVCRAQRESEGLRPEKSPSV